MALRCLQLNLYEMVKTISRQDEARLVSEIDGPG